MNKRKIMVLLVLTVAVIGLSMGVVSAKTVTVKKNHQKSIGHHHYAELSQNGNRFTIGIADKYAYGTKYKTSKAKVYFKYKGKTKVKTYKANKYGMIFNKKIPKGYKLIKAKLYYKKAKIDYPF